MLIKISKARGANWLAVKRDVSWLRKKFSYIYIFIFCLRLPVHFQYVLKLHEITHPADMLERSSDLSRDSMYYQPGKCLRNHLARPSENHLCIGKLRWLLLEMEPHQNICHFVKVMDFRNLRLHILSWCNVILTHKAFMWNSWKLCIAVKFVNKMQQCCTQFASWKVGHLQLQTKGSKNIPKMETFTCSK